MATTTQQKPAKATNGKPTTLAEALVSIQAEAPRIALDSTNPHYKSNYPSLAGVMERVLPVTSRHGMAISQLPTTLDGAPALTTRLIHASGEQIESTMLLLPAKPDPQGQGSALTYARRYMVLAMLGLVGDDDDDGQAGSEKLAEGQAEQVKERTAGFASEKQEKFLRGLLATAQVQNPNRICAYLAANFSGERDGGISRAIDGLKDETKRASTAANLTSLSENWATEQSDIPVDETDLEPVEGEVVE